MEVIKGVAPELFDQQVGLPSRLCAWHARLPSGAAQVAEFVGATRVIQPAQVARLSRKALTRALQWGTYFEQARHGCRAGPRPPEERVAA